GHETGDGLAAGGDVVRNANDTGSQGRRLLHIEQVDRNYISNPVRAIQTARLRTAHDRSDHRRGEQGAAGRANCGSAAGGGAALLELRRGRYDQNKVRSVRRHVGYGEEDYEPTLHLVVTDRCVVDHAHQIAAGARRANGGGGYGSGETQPG